MNGVDIAAPKVGRVRHDDLADCLVLCVDYFASVGAYVPSDDELRAYLAASGITRAVQPTDQHVAADETNDASDGDDLGLSWYVAHSPKPGAAMPLPGRGRLPGM